MDKFLCTRRVAKENPKNPDKLTKVSYVPFTKGSCLEQPSKSNIDCSCLNIGMSVGHGMNLRVWNIVLQLQASLKLIRFNYVGTGGPLIEF